MSPAGEVDSQAPVAIAAIPVVEAECEKSSATTYFWYREALDISNSISESGGLNWKMTLCLLVAWSIVGMAVEASRKQSSLSGKESAQGCLPKRLLGRPE